MNKYNSKRTYSQLVGRWFASKAEAVRGEELCLLEMAGEITDLQYQVRYKLSENPKVTITIDFSYFENDEYKLEDTKGVLTRDFRTKMCWLKQRFSFDVILSGTGR